MQNNLFVTISAVAGIINLVLVLIVTILPQWRVNSVVASQPNLNYLQIKEGLWIRCSGYPNQYFTCDMYDSSIIGLAAYLNAFRAFMIIALLLTLTGVVCSILGMRCTAVLEDEGKGKRWAVISGGACHILSGVLTGISVSWYASEVVREFYDPFNQNQNIKYTFGACLYVGWISLIFSLVCGCLMVCCTCFNKPVDQSNYAPSHGYKPTKEPYHDQFSMPLPQYNYNPDPYYKQKRSDHHHRSSYDRASSRHTSRSHRSHRSRDKRSYRSHRRSSRTSSSDDDSNYRSSRHESDIIRASGFV